MVVSEHGRFGPDKVKHDFKVGTGTFLDQTTCNLIVKLRPGRFGSDKVKLNL